MGEREREIKGTSKSRFRRKRASSQMQTCRATWKLSVRLTCTVLTRMINCRGCTKRRMRRGELSRKYSYNLLLFLLVFPFHVNLFSQLSNKYRAVQTNASRTRGSPSSIPSTYALSCAARVRTEDKKLQNVTRRGSLIMYTQR